MFKRNKNKRTFFEKITGAVHLDDDILDDEIEEEEIQDRHFYNEDEPTQVVQEDIEGELAVDVINTRDAIIIKAMIAGVRPNDIDIDLSRDMITIKASREDSHETSDEDFFQRELYWGKFSRNILLPEEIDVEVSEAKEKNGLLILILTKVDKNRKTKLQVKG